LYDAVVVLLDFVCEIALVPFKLALEIVRLLDVKANVMRTSREKAARLRSHLEKHLGGCGV